MSLADLVPVIQRTRFPRRIGRDPAKAAAAQKRWLTKNRRKFNAYRREWRQRKAA